MRIFPITSRENKIRALRAVKAIMGADGEEVVIRKITTDATREQEVWFNMLCKMIADETGNSPEGIKAHCKVECFGMETGNIGGVDVEWTPRTRKHGKKGLMQLIDYAYQFGGELGIRLPPPTRKEDHE